MMTLPSKLKLDGNILWHSQFAEAIGGTSGLPHINKAQNQKPNDWPETRMT